MRRTAEELIAELQRRLVELRAAKAELDRIIASVNAEPEQCLMHTPPCTKADGRWVEAS